MVLLEYNQNIINYFFEFWKRKNTLECLYAIQKQLDIV